MTRELLQQALDALKVSAWDHIHAVGKQALIDAIIDRLAQPDAEPVAWAMLRADGLILDVICPDERESYQGEYTVQLYAAPPAAPDIVNPITPAGMVTVPREPTQEMIAAGEAVFRSYCFRHVNGAIPTYEAMIAAAPAPAVREPLTDEQTDEIWDRFEQAPTTGYRYFVTRAILAAVGIGGGGNG